MGAADRYGPVPDGIVPLVGYRMWRVDRHAAEPVLFPLRSPSLDWFGATHGWVSATCPIEAAEDGDFGPAWSPHAAPAEGCSCGFYALKELQPWLVIAAWERRDPTIEGILVIGRVELAGKVVEHELGYRAERARVLELIPIYGDEGIVIAIAERAGIAVGRPVKVPRTPIRELGRRWRVSSTAAKMVSGEQGAYRPYLLILWGASIVWRVLISVHQAGGTP